MADFTLDTSGFVDGPPAGVRTKRIYWSDLSPFEQGYVEAMLRGQQFRRGANAPPWVGFSDLAPSTLEAIRKDCAAYQRRHGSDTLPASAGAAFWRMRQRGDYVGGLFVWPPLIIYVGCDGKVYARIAWPSNA